MHLANNKVAPEKVALITGASKRIGAQICRDLHAEGYNVVIHFQHSKSDAEALVQRLNKQREDSAMTIQGNLLDMTIFAIWLKTIIRHWGRLDLLINNASSFFPTPICPLLRTSASDESTMDKPTISPMPSIDGWDELMGTNLKAPYYLSLQCIPYLQNTKGKIINIIDIHGLDPLKNHSIYSMAKAGLVMMTKSLAKELAPDIKVNGIAPGAILWPEHEAEISLEKQQQIIQKTAMKKQGAASDVSNLVVFLASEAQYLTGNIIRVDGGRF